MTEKKRVPMSKQEGNDIAKANVLPEHVATWKAKGWTEEKPQTQKGDS